MIWSQANLSNQKIRSISFNGTNTIAGTYGNGIFFSTNLGLNWIQSNINNRYVNCLVINGNNTYAGTISNGIYVSTNNGEYWSQTNLNTATINSIAISGNTILGSGSNCIWLSSNNGTNWINIIGSAFANKYVYSVALSGANILAGTDSSGVWRSTNNGIGWIQTNLNNDAIHSLLASGNYVFAGAENSGVWYSSNNGTNWITKNQGFSRIPYISCLVTSNNYLFAGTYGYSVWRRTLSEIVSTLFISTEIPEFFSLGQNYPNPFNSSSKFKIQIAKSSDVKLVIYDITGRAVETLVNELLNPGIYSITWYASIYSSGIYFYTLTAGNYKETKRMMLIK